MLVLYDAEPERSPTNTSPDQNNPTVVSLAETTVGSSACVPMSTAIMT